MIICGVVPPHILTRVAEHVSDEASGTARATLEHMRELATGRAATLLERPTAAAPEPARSRNCRDVYDARNTFRLPGKLAMDEHTPRGTDVEVTEAYDGSGATYDFSTAPPAAPLTRPSPAAPPKRRRRSTAGT